MQQNPNSFACFLLCAQHAFMSACGQLRGLTMNACTVDCLGGAREYK